MVLRKTALKVPDFCTEIFSMFIEKDIFMHYAVQFFRYKENIVILHVYRERHICALNRLTLRGYGKLHGNNKFIAID